MANELKRNQVLKNLRDRSVQELLAEVVLLSKSLFAARARVFSGQTKDTSQIKKLRVSVARVKTLIAEKREHVCTNKECCN